MIVTYCLTKFLTIINNNNKIIIIIVIIITRTIIIIIVSTAIYIWLSNAVMSLQRTIYSQQMAEYVLDICSLMICVFVVVLPVAD